MVELKNIEDFDSYINEEKTLVDFYADWCGPCKMLEPVLEEYGNEHQDTKVVRVNTDHFQGLARKYGVMSIPNLKVFSKGKVIKEKVGFLMKNELEEFMGA